MCATCHTKDCIRGRREPVSDLVTIRGCELALFQPRKVGNMDCTFCLDCVHACPHDNVGILSRMPGAELLTDPLRSGIGYFSRRKDLAALAIVFTFGALLNAFGMVSPVYAVESWLGRMLHVSHEAPVLGIIFTFFLDSRAGRAAGSGCMADARVWAGSQRALLPLVVRYTYGLVPLGFGMWLAHYGFHFLTGLYTRHSSHPERAGESGMADSGRAALDSDRPARQHCASDRNWIPAAGICRIAAGDPWPGGRGFAASSPCARSFPGRQSA